MFDAIERIEIALRTQVIYQLSHKYGPHWQDQGTLFQPPYYIPKTGRTYDVFQDIQKHINDELNKNKKVNFIEHYLNTYDNPPTPPSWMSVELLYFSELSKFRQHFRDLLAKYPKVNVGYMGFPIGWETHPLWKNPK